MLPFARSTIADHCARAGFREVLGQTCPLLSEKHKVDRHGFMSCFYTSFFITKELTSLCYDLGLDLVHQDFPFLSIREKSLKENQGDGKLLSPPSLFCHSERERITRLMQFWTSV